MSKKAKDRKKAPAKKPATKTRSAKPVSTRGQAKHAEATAKHRKPVDRALPGLGQQKDAILERLCQSIHDQREVMNAAKQIEKGDTAAALQRMQTRGFQAFQYAGIELARVPGAEKLRVRMVDEEGSSSVDSPEAPATTDAVDDGFSADTDGEVAH